MPYSHQIQCSFHVSHPYLCEDGFKLAKIHVSGICGVLKEPFQTWTTRIESNTLQFMKNVHKQRVIDAFPICDKLASTHYSPITTILSTFRVKSGRLYSSTGLTSFQTRFFSFQLFKPQSIKFLLQLIYNSLVLANIH